MKTFVYPKVQHKILALVLACCMIFTLIPTTTFATQLPTGELSMCAHHAEHTPECGYTEAKEGIPCSFITDVPEEASLSDADEEVIEPIAHIHDEDCGYIEKVEGIPCAFVCDICNQAPEQKDCTCPPVEDGEIVHDEGCTLYEKPTEKPTVPEQTEAVQAVIALINALPTMDEIATVDPESEGFADYLAHYSLTLPLHVAPMTH